MSKINVIPKPAKTTFKDGFVDLKQVNEILLASGSEAETAIADIIKRFLSPIKNLSIKTGGVRLPNSLFIKIDSSLSLGEEGYSLSIDRNNSIEIKN